MKVTGFLLGSALGHQGTLNNLIENNREKTLKKTYDIQDTNMLVRYFRAEIKIKSKINKVPNNFEHELYGTSVEKFKYN